MRTLLALVLATFLPLAAVAADGVDLAEDLYLHPAGDSDLSEFLWTKRVLVVFADTEADPRFQKQIEMLTEGREVMQARDVVVLTDTDPDVLSPVRKKLRPRGFALVWVDKDGVIKLRKPAPWSVRELTASIDKTPMRAQEVRDRRQERSGG